MLNQGPAPDPKCKLNNSPVLTIPHLLHCLICTRICVHCILTMNDVGMG